ncbi:hypothetical protein EFN79_02360 [Propionibacterium freudenreichii]|uniref:hypothetical protein n=1 Tax=Propionibacterium freudenreichii TaxID=1744 RepID=UPI0021A699E3|nr:hypothetical protein [Propionibacterium freudenreichii]MCT2977624.1 hypothetical protein [Propionibacterium freudenreichii]MCT2985393.1 hypothetical protein [Propionibacterium freudenreichii]MCT2986986.1 hypothetical protein [Propionibacterium freudenreichii]
MSELPEPSAWFTEHFGEYSQRVMLALANAGRAAHERSLDAKTGSQLATNEAYGSFWVSLPEEVVAHLDFLPGHEVIRPAGSRYDLIVFDGTLIFPAKCGRGSCAVDRIRLGQSGLRRRVFSLEDNTVSVRQEQLDFDFSLDNDLDAALKDGSFGSATRVVLIAYDASARGGLQHVYVGDAALDSSGLVTWRYREELPLRLLDGEGTALAGLGELAARFDDAPLPESDLTLRSTSELLSGEDDETDTTGTGTEGEPNGRP